LLIVGGHAGIQAGPEHFRGFRGWPKTSLDFRLREARFTGISEGPNRLAEEDGFQPALDSSWNPH
jgi:hypothetical protein